MNTLPNNWTPGETGSNRVKLTPNRFVSLIFIEKFLKSELSQPKNFPSGQNICCHIAQNCDVNLLYQNDLLTK